jgi:2-methylcitrate dehydratase PrpD
MAVAEVFAEWASGLEEKTMPENARTVASNALLDVAGLCIAAGESDYIRAALAAWDGAGACTALGHGRGLDAAGAALINGTAAHGEDFDDSFEGTPVHASAVVLPAVLAAAERYGGTGSDVLRGYVVGCELMCRLALVAPTAIHRAGFHPTAVIGALGAAAGVGATLRLAPGQLTSALGVAGSMASGIIEYLAEGTWTKRLHAGWWPRPACALRCSGGRAFSGPAPCWRVWIWLLVDGQAHVFLDRDVEIELPADVRIVLENADMESTPLDPEHAGLDEPERP